MIGCRAAGPEGRGRISGLPLYRRRLRLREPVVVERSREDRRVDPTGDILERAQAGRSDHRLHPSPFGDDAGGRLLGPAVPLGAGERTARVTLVEPGLVAAASAAPARTLLGQGGAGAAT